MPHRPLVAVLVLGLSALAGCKGEQPQAVPSQEEIRAAVQQVAEEAKARVNARYATEQEQATPEPVVAPLVSWATFERSNLDVCVDVVSPPGSPRVAGAEKFAAESIANAGKNSKGEPLAMRLGKACAQQFSDRVALATCTVGAPDDGVILRVYNIVTLDDSDAYAKQCLSMSGDWRPDSDAIESARRQDSMKRLRRLAGN